MKMFSKFAAFAALALVSVAPASAAVVDVSGATAFAGNMQSSSVTQGAVAVNASLGSIYDSTVDVAATNANNVVSTNIDIDQTNYVPVDFLQYSAVLSSAVNYSLAPVTQLSLASNLTGAVAMSAVSVGATNANNVAATTITVKQ